MLHLIKMWLECAAEETDDRGRKTRTKGPSLGSGLFCPGPSSLNRPHPPHSRAHRDFTAWRLIRDAFAVRERLGDPRVVPSFRCAFFPGMPSPETPESPIIVSSSRRCRRGLRRE